MSLYCGKPFGQVGMEVAELTGHAILAAMGLQHLRVQGTNMTYRISVWILFLFACLKNRHVFTMHFRPTAPLTHQLHYLSVRLELSEELLQPCKLRALPLRHCPRSHLTQGG